MKRERRKTLAMLSRFSLACWMTGAFCVVQAVYYAYGVRFNDVPLANFAQILDTELLRNRLAESLWYLHCQPPFFNLFIGMILKLFPTSYYWVFTFLYLLCGWVLYLATFRLMRLFDVSRSLALVLSSLFLLSPSFVLFEHWLFYALPVTTLLVLAALALHGGLTTGQTRPYFGFFLCLALIGGMWSLFHLVYPFLLAGVLWAIQREHRTAILRAAWLPLLMLLLIYLKNALVFGRFTVSTWAGMNMAWGISERVPLETRQRLVREGQLSEVVLLPPFSELEKYPARYREVETVADAPVLRQVRKSSGFVNYNHPGYIALADQYGESNRVLLKRFPLAYARGVGQGLLTYVSSSSDYLYSGEENRNRLSIWIRLYDMEFYGRLLPGNHPLCLFLLLGLPLTFAVGVVAGVRPGILRVRLDSAQRGLALFMAFTILFVAVTANLLNPIETNRIRFTTDPLSLALLGLFLHRAGVWRKRVGESS